MDVCGRKLAKGPYVLTFELSTKDAAKGDFFFTTKPTETLPRPEGAPGR